MLRSRAFVKRTRKGNVVRVVKEHYLRDDIHCGFCDCQNPVCLARKKAIFEEGEENGAGQKALETNAPLSADPRDSTKWGKHYLIPDTNVFINQIDILEKPVLCDVIVLGTVLEELKGLSMAVYSRVRSIVSNHGAIRRWFVFSNEHHRETFVDREKDESPNDRNDRAIRVATKWYNTHLKERYGISALMLTDDANNRKLATESGIPTEGVKDYLETFVDHPELIEMMSSVTIQRDKDWEGYTDHITSGQIQAGLKSGFLVQGTLQVASYNYLEGSIFGQGPDGKEQKILIVGRKAMNRAIHGDRVVVKLLPKSEWKSVPSTAIEDEDEDTVPESASENKDKGKDAVVPEKSTADGPSKKKIRVSDEPKDDTDENDAPAIPLGEVVGIIQRHWRPYCCFVDPKQHISKSATGDSAMRSLYVLAMDRRIPKIRIMTRQANKLVGQRLLVALDAWPKESRYPQGHFVRLLGSAGDRATETEVLLLEHDVPYQEFSAKVLADLPAEGDKWLFDPERDGVLAGKRRDLRDINVCSIDPPGCTDIDDALHARKLPNGNFEVGVHIADVTHFVKPNTAMDAEAANRSTTVYLVDKRIDMLPPLLGTNLCSLHCNVDRLAFSCIWEVDSDANIVNVDFCRSVIHSKASFTYGEAQARIDDPSNTDDLTEGVRTLNRLAKKMRAKRMAAGALTLSSPEVRFKLENNSQDPVDVEMKALQETNALVEEFMLLANISVARKIFSHFPDTALLRRHPTPPPQNFDNLQRALASLSMKLDIESSLTLGNSLDKAVLPEDPYFNTLVRILTTRCMMQAVYFCSGTVNREDFNHYGLATEIYTHFTSPIRRYSDVMVHRLLAASIDKETVYGDELTNKTKMREQCDTLNHRHRMAQQAGRSSVELFTNLFFKGKTVIEDGYVTQILQNGFSVLIPQYGIEGIVYTTDKDAKNTSTPILKYNSDTNRLESATSPDSAVIYLFQKVKVLLEVDDQPVSANVSSMRRKLHLRLLTPNIEGLSVPQDELKAIKSKIGDSLKDTGDDTRHKEEEKLAEKITADPSIVDKI
ncbi:exosome catalytic subunit dis3 [Mycoemilia scoparia]|uniref:Ribosomal RNA-processing protein 44 n=1 Tax=Mycoemilia scoparia TaxID=417184 RepID=A0A9W8DX55_9FUNG|nr:exosome catalytic subunit dis3 [Mycoemilia scoparia]